MDRLSPFTRFVLFISLSLATFMIVLDYSIANVSIPYIAGDLAVSNEEGTYVITSFAVGNAIGLALTAWLTRRLGAVKLLVASILLFTLFSWTCGLSTDLVMIIVSRFIQGLVAGPVIPLSQSLLLREGTEKSRPRDIAIFSTVVITAPVFGPILGGYISDWYVWSWIFYINIPVGLYCALTIWAIMHKRETPTEKAPSDIIGIVLLVFWVSCLQILLDKGEDWDWLNSNRIRLLMIGAVIGFTYFIIRELWHRAPLMQLRLFKIPSFSLSVFCLLVSYAIYFGTIVLVPLWLQEYMGYTAEWAGFAVCTIGVAPVFLTMLVPRIMQWLGYLWTLIVGFFFFGLACFLTSYFFTTNIDIVHIAWSRFIFGFGFIFYINPLISMNVQDISQDGLPSAAGIFHFVRAMIGGVGTSVFTTQWIRRTIFHHERIGGSLTPFNPFTPPATNEASLAQLNASLDQQSSILALNDSFFLMGWLFVGLIVLLIGWYFFGKKSLQKQSVPAAVE